MGTLTTETFFLPDAIAREAITIPAALYNRCRLLLSRCQYEHVFVPIRNMQYLAVLDAQEIIFVDSQAYAVRGGEGGRMILLAWRFRPELRPDSLSAPVPIELIYYHPGAPETQKRLLGEFNKALDVLEARAQQGGCEPRAKKVLPFRS
ncbi:MAG: hypothetical protein RLZ44_1538 [Pseudomonadota bacterium]